MNIGQTYVDLKAGEDVALTDATPFELAELIEADPAYESARWCAGPYVQALGTLENVNDGYGADYPGSVKAYLLGNLTQWRGPVARAVKAELKRRK